MKRLVNLKKYKTKSIFLIVSLLVLLLLIAGSVSFTLKTATGAKGAIALENNVQAENTLIAAPFKSIAAELSRTCEFPVFLPAYFPSPGKGNEWSLTSEVKSGTFSIEINRQPFGYTGRTHPLVDWYGIFAGNVGTPSEQPLVKQFRSDSGITVNDLSLPCGIKGKEYIADLNVAGGTAISWEKDGWSFFVNAYPTGDSSTTNCANQIIEALKDSGQALPGSQGKFYFIYNGNMPMTEVFWEAKPNVWYELDSRDPKDVIKILQSMRIICG